MLEGIIYGFEAHPPAEVRRDRCGRARADYTQRRWRPRRHPRSRLSRCLPRSRSAPDRRAALWPRPGTRPGTACCAPFHGRCSTSIQGIAWIDKSTFRIVRMQTDLLSPLPVIQLNELRSVLDYGEVKIPERNLLLWLPRDVDIKWRVADRAGEEFHTYSNYRLFAGTSPTQRQIWEENQNKHQSVRSARSLRNWRGSRGLDGLSDALWPSPRGDRLLASASAK